MLLAVLLLLPIAASDAYCDARAFGAAGDGVSDDTAAIAAALGACDHVVLRKGSYLSGTVRLRSHSVLEIRASAALLAIKAKRGRYSRPEADFYRKRKKTAWNQGRNRVMQRRFNAWNQDRFQDYGHSNLDDALILIHDCENVTLRGGGAVDGRSEIPHTEPVGGRFDPATNYPTKLIVVKSSKNVAIHGSAGEPLRLARGGWITLLLNNASHAVVRHVDVAAARDGVNVISSRHVKLDRLHVRGGSDDAIALKSDWALRRVLPMYDVQVTNSVVRSEKCNGLQIGSEDRGQHLRHLIPQRDGARRRQGGHIHRDHGRVPHLPGPLRADPRAQNVQALAFIVVGARLRRPGIGDAQVVMDEWIGTISDVSINNVLAHNVSAPNAWKGYSYNYSTHLDGLAKGRWTSGSKRSVPAYEALENHPLGPRISITNVRAEVWGKGEAAMKLWEPAHNPKSYVERNVGPSPAFGAFVRNAVDVTLEKWDVRAAHNDDRPAFVFDGVRGNRLVNSAADRGAASAFDVGLRNAADVAVHGGLKAVDEGAFEVRQRIKPPLNSGLPYPPYFFDT
ncbi:glycosyl hydrolase [Aureococcus anophagefferens]|nr:glycosyl hydrolase [Aureococcus anophagefferens]